MVRGLERNFNNNNIIMGHFAKIVNNKVVQVIAADTQEFVDSLPKTNELNMYPSKWIQTSYNTQGGVHLLGGTPLRKNFAWVGAEYDEVRDAFYKSQPYDSWTLNENTCYWEAPIARPEDGLWNWDEANQVWVEISL